MAQTKAISHKGRTYFVRNLGVKVNAALKAANVLESILSFSVRCCHGSFGQIERTLLSMPQSLLGWFVSPLFGTGLFAFRGPKEKERERKIGYIKECLLSLRCSVHVYKRVQNTRCH